jgi:hypothetical protein
MPVSILKGSGRMPPRPYPGEGTVARRLYDRLLAAKGKPVYVGDMVRSKARYVAVIKLRDEYGCDIRSDGNAVFALTGEWFGDDYVDYHEVAA